MRIYNLERLRELKEMHDLGLIEPEEFARRQQAILDGAFGASDPGDGERDSPRRKRTTLGLIEGMLLGHEDRRYRLEKLLGEGGMGEVWKAEDLAETEFLGRPSWKAIKVLREELARDPNHRKWIKLEAIAASQFAHHNILRIVEWREDPNTGWPFIVMEYLSGRDLNAVLADEGDPGLPLKRVLELMTPVAGALDYAWDKHKLVHRDLKPENVFLTDKGEVKLLDFGIAAQVKQSSAVLGLEGRESAGTAGYRAPEGSTRQKEPSPRIDVYSFGVMIYELLEGHAPFEGARSRDHEPGKPDALNEKQWEVLKRAFAYEPGKRFGSALETLTALRIAKEPSEDELRRQRREEEEQAEKQRREAEQHRAREERRKDEEERRNKAQIVSEHHSAEARPTRATDQEAAARRAREERAQRESDERARAEAARRKAEETVTMPQPSPRKSMFAALAVVAVIGVLAAVFYLRDDVGKQAADADAGRAAVQRARLEANEKAADAVRRAEEAKRETERMTQTQADERARLEAEVRSKADATRKVDEAKRKTELVARAAAELRARKEAEAKANAESGAKATLEAEARARREVEEMAKAEAARVAQEKEALEIQSEQQRSRSAAEQTTPASKYEVRRGDTLLGIARKTRHASVTVNQMLIAIYHANLSAFPGENPRGFAIGSVFVIPSKEEVAAISREEADRLAREYIAKWTAVPPPAPALTLP